MPGKLVAVSVDSSNAAAIQFADPAEYFMHEALMNKVPVSVMHEPILICSSVKSLLRFCSCRCMLFDAPNARH